VQYNEHKFFLLCFRPAIKKLGSSKVSLLSKVIEGLISMFVVIEQYYRDAFFVDLSIPKTHIQTKSYVKAHIYSTHFDTPEWPLCNTTGSPSHIRHLHMCILSHYLMEMRTQSHGNVFCLLFYTLTAMWRSCMTDDIPKTYKRISGLTLADFKHTT
jgi:hypothetical protein